MMTTTETILNYAAKKRGTFLRKELLADIARQQPAINKRAVDLQLSRLVASIVTGTGTWVWVPVFMAIFNPGTCPRDYLVPGTV